jgi:hypothetical protein
MSLVDELEALAEPADLDGTAGAAADDAAAAKRFKKSAPEAAPAQPAAPALTATAPALTATAPLAPAAPTDASGWDFEKDLENIFTTQAREGEKPRGKAKSKGAQ